MKIMSDISNEYAEALFALAVESGSERATLAELEEVLAAFDENAELYGIISSPAVPIIERTEILDTVFASSLSEYTLSFLKLLCEKRRTPLLKECVEDYRALLRIKEATVTARVVSAVPLTEAEADALKKKLEKTSGLTVALDLHTDPSLIGGMTVEMNGKVTDGSISHRLREVKEVMSR